MISRSALRALSACVFLAILTGAQATTFSRATLSVADAEASLAFYCDLLGFSINSRAEYDTPAMRAMFSIPDDSTPTLILLDSEDGQERALALITAPGMQIDAESNQVNAPTLVLTTTELDRIHRDMRSSGATIVQPPTPLRD